MEYVCLDVVSEGSKKRVCVIECNADFILVTMPFIVIKYLDNSTVY